MKLLNKLFKVAKRKTVNKALKEIGGQGAVKTVSIFNLFKWLFK